MINRFKIPQYIKGLLLFKGKPLDAYSGEEITEVFDGIAKLRGSEKNPAITVALAAYNEEENLYATLRSLSKQQTKHNVEIVVVNNNSTDRTAELARKCGARVINETQQGVSFARQTALKEALAPIYVSCDADTLYPPTWLDTLVAPLFKDDKVSVTYSLHCLYDEANEYKFSFYLYQYAKWAFTILKSFKRGQLNCGGASMAFRTENGLAVGGYNTNIQRGEDGYIALQMRKFGTIKMVASKRAFIYTSNRRTLGEGNIGKSFLTRAAHGFKHIFSFFSNQDIPS